MKVEGIHTPRPSIQFEDPPDLEQRQRNKNPNKLIDHCNMKFLAWSSTGHSDHQALPDEYISLFSFIWIRSISGESLWPNKILLRAALCKSQLLYNYLAET